MTESLFLTNIRNIGYIETIPRVNSLKNASEEKTKLEDYVAKITMIFSPYLSCEISENKFMSIQNELKNILNEISINK